MFVPGPGEKDQTKINAFIRELASGRTNATGTVTLTPSATTTVVFAPNCMADSIPFLSPLTATAAAAGAWISSVSKGQFTITHTSSVATDKTFGFVCLG